MPQNANSGIVKGSTVHGARVYMTINGQRVGYIKSFSASQQVNQGDVEVLDNILTEEHVPLGITYSGNIERMMLVGSSLIRAGLNVSLDNIFARGAENVQIVDRPSGGRVLLNIQRIAFTGNNFSISKGVLTANQVSFKAIKVADEDGLINV